MSVVQSSNRINIERLDAELGYVGVRAQGGHPEAGTSTLYAAPVEQAVLQAAIDAHVFIDFAGNEAAIRSRIDGALAANAAFVALPSPTAGQTIEQVTRLTKQVSAALRLLDRRLDATD